MKYIITFIVIVNIVFLSFAQDAQYSQFYNSDLNTNPALCGSYIGDLRVFLNRRSQWGSITIPYVTNSFSTDINLFNKLSYENSNRFLFADKIGLGLNFNQDKSGDSDFGSTYFAFNFAYHKAFDKYKRNIISLGLSGRYSQFGFKSEKLYFDEQYVNGQFNVNNAHSEIFSSESKDFGDLGLGFNYFKLKDNKLFLSFGASVSNLFKPSINFYQNTVSKINTKSTINLNTYLQLNSKTQLEPGLFYGKQGEFSFINLGSNIKYVFGSDSLNSPKENNPLYLNFGTWYRLKDAIILYLGIEKSGVQVGMSYDFNISDLSEVSNYMGGYELSIIYRISAPPKDRPKIENEYKICPVFL